MTTAYPTVFPTEFPTVASCTTVELNTEIRGPNDYVGVIFSACPSQSAFEAFTGAAQRWSAIVAENKIIPSVFGESFDVREVCTFLQNPFQFSGTFVFDHLTIFAETVEIDGAGGVLASAGPCLVDSLEQFFPILGGMRFDNADLADLDAQGTLQAVITHEMGHILGLGTLWQIEKQGGGAADFLDELLLQDPVFDQNLGTITPSNLPKFVGTNGIAELEALSGQNENFVPVEDGKDFNGNAFFNAALGEGQGSIDGHWKFTRFVDELMVFQIDPSEPNHPLSRMTISSLQDLGYSVNLGEADAYTLPFGRRSSTSKALRGAGDDKSKIVDLSGDIAISNGGYLTKENIKRKIAQRKAARSELKPLERQP